MEEDRGKENVPKSRFLRSALHFHELRRSLDKGENIIITNFNLNQLLLTRIIFIIGKDGCMYRRIFSL